MSAPTEENKKPAGIESFLIVAYRSLRGSKQTSAFGCPKDILNASPEKIEEMKQKACFIQEDVDPGLVTQVTREVKGDGQEATFRCQLLFRWRHRSNRPSFEVYKPPLKELLINGIVGLNIRDSFYIHKGGFSGLTVIIYDCYVVTLSASLPKVERYYRDETGEIKCETTAIPIKPQVSYFGGWVSYGRSFHHHDGQVFYIDSEGRLAGFKMRDPLNVEVQSPSDNQSTGAKKQYVDVKIHDFKNMGIFAVTSCGTIDYYQGVKKLVYSHTIDTESPLLSCIGSKLAFITIACDADYLSVGFLESHAALTRPSIIVYRISRKGLRPTGITQIGVLELIPNERVSHSRNCIHHLSFMYPKRYRILYAQQLFTLGSLIYVGKDSVVHLCTVKLANGGVMWNFRRNHEDRESFYSASNSGILHKIRINISCNTRRATAPVVYTRTPSGEIIED